MNLYINTQGNYFILVLYKEIYFKEMGLCDYGSWQIQNL